MARKPAQVEETDQPDDDDDTLGMIQLEGSLEDVEKPKVLPAGKYPGTIVNVEPARSGRGNVYYATTFRVETDDFPESFEADNAPDGLELFYNRIIRPRSAGDRRALWNLKTFIRALGLESDVTEIDINDWMGCRALLITGIDTYQGEKRTQILRVERLDEGGSTRKPRAKPVEAEEEVEERRPARRARR